MLEIVWQNVKNQKLKWLLHFLINKLPEIKTLLVI